MGSAQSACTTSRYVDFETEEICNKCGGGVGEK